MNALRLEDIRLAIRRLRKDAGATASVAALACGIGAAVAAWSLLSTVLLKPLPVMEQAGMPQRRQARSRPS